MVCLQSVDILTYRLVGNYQSWWNGLFWWPLVLYCQLKLNQGVTTMCSTCSLLHLWCFMYIDDVINSVIIVHHSVLNFIYHENRV